MENTLPNEYIHVFHAMYEFFNTDTSKDMAQVCDKQTKSDESLYS